jgi:3' exoribonuclease, RNase T-like
MTEYRNIFIDTEFIETGRDSPVRLLSIGMVDEQGVSYYAEAHETAWCHAGEWVRKNVLPQLHQPDPHCKVHGKLRKIEEWVGGDDSPGCTCFAVRGPRRTFKEMQREIAGYIGNYKSTGVKSRFWGYFADYDWVVFCQIFGTMSELPEWSPYYCFDLKQAAEHLGLHKSDLPKQDSKEHNALNDAQWNLKVYQFLKTKAPPGFVL